MNRSFVAALGVVSLTFAMGACMSVPSDVEPAAVKSYSVRYYPNNATGGSVPEDTTNYEVGEVVRVEGNTEGTLVNAGFSFNGWNTSPVGNGITFDSRGIYGPSSFQMGPENMKLYAVWADPAVGTWNLTSVNDRPLALAQDEFQAMTLRVSAEMNSWTMISTPVYGQATTSTGNWTVSETAVNYALVSGNIVIFNAIVADRTMTLIPTSMATMKVLVFSKQ